MWRCCRMCSCCAGRMRHMTVQTSVYCSSILNVCQRNDSLAVRHTRFSCPAVPSLSFDPPTVCCSIHLTWLLQGWSAPDCWTLLWWVSIAACRWWCHLVCISCWLTRDGARLPWQPVVVNIDRCRERNGNCLHLVKNNLNNRTVLEHHLWIYWHLHHALFREYFV